MKMDVVGSFLVRITSSPFNVLTTITGELA